MICSWCQFAHAVEYADSDLYGRTVRRWICGRWLRKLERGAISVDRRRRNVEWQPAEEDGRLPNWERVIVILLMDLRDELQAIRRRLDCPETGSIPRTLRRIATNTAKPRRTK